MSDTENAENTMVSEINCFPALHSKFEFVEMDKTNPEMMVARKHWRFNGENCSSLGLLKVRDVEIDILKRYDIWNSISIEIQKEIENMTVEEKKAVSNLKARGSRKEKYKNVPRFICCVTCQAKIPIAPGTLVKKVEKIAKEKGILYTIEDFLKTYQCTKCNPGKKGRQANPEFASLPKMMTCRCGEKVSTNPYQLKKKAEKNNTTILKLIEEFVCQKCNPKHLGRKNTGKCTPTTLTCKCGKTVIYPANVVVKRAEAKGLTVEKYISDFSCQSCTPTKRRTKKETK